MLDEPSVYLEIRSVVMLIEYIQAAMKQAKYKILEDGTYFGEIPGFPGLWASADTLEACRDELQSALEDWIVLGLQMGHDLPSVAGLRLVPEMEMLGV
jgi:predicted RNase H-like HicB family nuclease